MKKTLLLAVAGTAAIIASAKPLTPQQALSRVQADAGRRNVRIEKPADAMPVMTVKDAANEAALYVFSNAPGSGYMIVSADDCAAPLLGYSDSGTFNKDEMPPQLRWWLDFYAGQIARASQKGVQYSATASATSAREAIAPMIKTKWDQGSPYNDDCPMDNGARSVTGCVATAMAQAMYYHQWPAKGTGSHSYSWNGTTLSVDFASTTYDWDAMTLTYDKNSSAEAKAAVANLMYSCGVSVDMDYTSDESGASSMEMVSALYKYFNYDKSMTYPQRSFYGEQDWEDMVYTQLSEGLPVLYGGQSSEGGHQFICDGYDGDGYFHFNWGWSGVSDGYYLLSALNPLDQGIGGSASDSGFNYDQGIVLNMKPAQTGSEATPLIYCYSNFGTTATGSVSLGSEVDFNGDYFNFACADVKGNPGIKIVAEDGSVSYVKHSSKLDFGSFSGYSKYAVTLPSTLADGTYTVTPAFLPDGATEWIPILCPLSGVQALTMTVQNGQASFADDITNAIQVSDFTLNTPIYLGQDFSTSFTMTNTGTTEYFGEYLIYLFDQNGKEVAASADINTIDLMPGDSQSITYVSSIPEEVSTDEGTEQIQAGTYYLVIGTHFTKQVIYQDESPVNVQAAPTQTVLAVESLTVNGGKSVVNTSDVEFEGVLECETGYFAGKVKVAVFKDGTSETSMSGESDYVFLSQGSTANFEAHVDISSADAVKFFAVVFADGKQISNGYYFTISAAGVVEVAGQDGILINLEGDSLDITSDTPLASLAIYAVDGREALSAPANGRTQLNVALDSLPSGEYVVVVSDTNGVRATKTLIK